MNTLREALQEYLDLRRGLGYKMHDAGLLLPKFVNFMEERRAEHISARLALEWANVRVQPAEWARRLCFVRGFARHRSATDSRTEIPPIGLLPHRSTRARPHLYTEEEVRRLLDAALELPVAWPSTPLRPWVFHGLIGLPSATGPRLSGAEPELPTHPDQAVLTSAALFTMRPGRSIRPPAVSADYQATRAVLPPPVSNHVFVAAALAPTAAMFIGLTRCRAARLAHGGRDKGHGCMTSAPLRPDPDAPVPVGRRRARCPAGPTGTSAAGTTGT
jgi:hypothetical protein